MCVRVCVRACACVCMYVCMLTCVFIVYKLCMPCNCIHILICQKIKIFLGEVWLTFYCLDPDTARLQASDTQYIITMLTDRRRLQHTR